MGLEYLVVPQGKEVIPTEGSVSEGGAGTKMESEQQNNNFTL